MLSYKNVDIVQFLGKRINVDKRYGDVKIFTKESLKQRPISQLLHDFYGRNVTSNNCMLKSNSRTVIIT